MVEGADDISFLNGKLHQSTDIQESFSGKLGVFEIVAHFSDDRVIGICDTDYDAPNTCPQIFYYDYSCLEMMMVSNIFAFSQIFFTYYHGEEKPQEVRLQLITNLKWLSICRKLSAENGWGINFKGLSISNAFNPTTRKLETANLLSQINKLNPGYIPAHRTHLNQISQTCLQELDQEDLLKITQGHDFLAYFQALCASAPFRGKTAGVTELAHSLICSYRNGDFATSVLYKNLLEYQITYSLNILPSCDE